MARRRLDAGQSKTIILDAVERLMQREGYAAVTTRRVALEAGFQPTLVHYHFDTTDNLLLAAYRRTAGRAEQLLLDAIASDQPLHALWRYNSDPARMQLATQFMALAGQRPLLAEEIAGTVRRHRALQVDLIARLTPPIGEQGTTLSPSAFATLLAAAGRMFAMEMMIGVDDGHGELRAQLEHLVDQIEPPAAP